jgi:hypothetical protein
MRLKILVSWLGIADLKAAGLMPNNAEESTGDGPILGALRNLSFDELHLLHNYDQPKFRTYVEWLTQ